MDKPLTIDEILINSIGHINEEGKFCATYKGRACNCGIDEAKVQLATMIEQYLAELIGPQEHDKNVDITYQEWRNELRYEQRQKAAAIVKELRE